MFTKVPICMRAGEGNLQFLAVLNTDQISSVFSYDEGRLCSIMMSNGDKLMVDLPFEEVADRLLSMSKTPLDS